MQANRPLDRTTAKGFSTLKIVVSPGSNPGLAIRGKALEMAAFLWVGSGDFERLRATSDARGLFVARCSLVN
jgi:hypothetical protein